MANYSDESTYSTASGIDGLKYVVLQVTLKEKFLGPDPETYRLWNPF